MDEIKNLYREIIRDEVESPEVQSAKEAFLRKNFKAAPPAAGPWKKFIFAPSVRLALVGCIALAVLVKTGTFETAQQLPLPEQHPVIENIEVNKVVESLPVQQAAATAISPASAGVVSSQHVNNIRIKKLTSQMGATMTYQKDFPDAKITVLWLLPEGA